IVHLLYLYSFPTRRSSDLFSVNVPKNWTTSSNGDGYFFTSTSGEDNLLVTISATKPDVAIIGAPDELQIKNITIDNKPAIQMYRSEERRVGKECKSWK